MYYRKEISNYCILNLRYSRKLNRLLDVKKINYKGDFVKVLEYKINFITKLTSVFKVFFVDIFRLLPCLIAIDNTNAKSILKELSLCHKLKITGTYIFAT